MALLVNGFEAGATVGDGNAVVAGTSGYTGGNAFSLVSAGTTNTLTYSAANKIQGAYAGLFTSGGTANASLVQLADASGSASFATRVYVNLLSGGFPAAGGLGIQARSTTDTRIAAVYIDPTGKIRITGPGSTGDVAIGTVAVSTTGPTRLEFTGTGINTTSSTFTAVAYAGDSTTATDTITAAGVSTSTTGLADRARTGKMNAAIIGAFALDSFAVNIGSATRLGPAITASSDYVRRSGGWVGYTPFVRRSGAWV